MPELKDRLNQIDDDITQARKDAATKWSALDAAKKAIAEASGPIDPDGDAFKALDEAGKDYGSMQDKITGLERVKSGLVNALTAEGILIPTGGDDPTTGKDMKELLDELRSGKGLHAQMKSAGERITEGDLYKNAQKAGEFGRKRVNVELGEGWGRKELKALLTGGSDTSGGAFVQPDRIGYFPLPLRPLTLLDLITVGETDSDLVEYVRMTSFTNSAAEVAEAISAAPITPRDGSSVTAIQGGRKPESGMAFEIVQEGVSNIAHWIPATRRALSDAGQLRTIIDGMLRWGLDDRLERQLMSGNGVGDNLLGLLNTTGLNSVAAGAQSHIDKLHAGITQIRLDNLEPTGIALHPTDWQTIRLARENTGGAGTGGYLAGSPFGNGPDTLWGKPVVVTASVPQGTGIVGAWRALVLWMREGAQVLASDSHEDYFTRNLIAILAEMRCTSGVPMPMAFCEVDFAAS